LGVDGIELYRAVSGETVVIAGAEVPWPPGLLFRAIDRIIHDPDFGANVRALLRSKAATAQRNPKTVEIAFA